MKLRKHQEEARRIAIEISNGMRNDRIVAAYVTPGGGKTLLASLYANGLGGDIDRVLVVCPRLTLRKQMAAGFVVPELGCNRGLATEYHGTNWLLKRDLLGNVVTYQELVAEATAGGMSKWLRFASELRTLLILDEAHHLNDPKAGPEEKGYEGWTRAVAPLVAVAHRVLIMTGTPKRTEGAIAFIDYLRHGGPFAISYSRQAALGERAIINVSVKLCDGHATYWHQLARQEQDLSTASGKEESRALRTLLSDSLYRNRMLDLAMEEFRVYRATRYPSAQAIVIAADQKQARAIAKHLQERSWRTVLAISEEKDAHHRLAQFRDHGFGDVLVTVGMAYEGMDVPRVTHLIALTHYRASGWLDQALSRATRFDHKSGIPWEQQTAFLYVPNDHTMSSFLREWVKEQDPTPNQPPEAHAGHEGAPRASTFAPISGEMTTVDYADTYVVYSSEDRDRLRRLDEDQNIDPSVKILPPAVKLHLARRMWPGLEVVN